MQTVTKTEISEYEYGENATIKDIVQDKFFTIFIILHIFFFAVVVISSLFSPDDNNLKKFEMQINSINESDFIRMSSNKSSSVGSMTEKELNNEIKESNNNNQQHNIVTEDKNTPQATQKEIKPKPAIDPVKEKTQDVQPKSIVPVKEKIPEKKEEVKKEPIVPVKEKIPEKKEEVKKEPIVPVKEASEDKTKEVKKTESNATNNKSNTTSENKKSNSNNQTNNATGDGEMDGVEDINEVGSGKITNTSQMDIIRIYQHIRNCWHKILATLQIDQDIFIDAIIQYDKTGKLLNYKIIQNNKKWDQLQYDITVNTLKKTIENCSYSISGLNPNNYENWKKMDIRFRYDNIDRIID